MKKIIILLLLIPLFVAGALHWPVRKILLTASFGESRTDHFHNGIDLGREGQSVTPVQKGKLLYYFDEGEHPLYQEYGNGNVVVLQHNKNASSYYYHLKKNSIMTEQKDLTINDTFAISGNTGRSLGGHLHVSYKQNGKIINPLKKLPPINDKTKPTIASIYMLVDNRLITVPKKFKVSGIDRFRILVKTYDTYKKIKRLNVLGIYKLAFYIDDRKVLERTFNQFIDKNNRMVLGDGNPFEEVYSKSGYYNCGTYKNIVGIHTFRVKVWDFYNNVRSRVVRVHFR